MAWLLILLSVVFAMAPAKVDPAWGGATADALERTAHCRTAANAPANVLPFSEVRRRIGDDVVRAVLCQDGQTWLYRVTTIGAAGVVRTLLFDARTGAAFAP